MFRSNKSHYQTTFFNELDNLPETARKMLDKSWASSFYTDYFCKIDETVFRPLYSDVKSRPNTPINILLSIETLKSGFGWSDEELYQNFLFNLQIRYALGLYNLHEGYFNLRTMYNFRKTLREYEKKHNVNLIEKAFENVTDKQIETIKIKTVIQRMDSTLIQSNIRNMGRLQTIVEFLPRMNRVLKEADKEIYRELFKAYIAEAPFWFGCIG